MDAEYRKGYTRGRYDENIELTAQILKEAEARRNKDDAAGYQILMDLYRKIKRYG